jgi:tetratricopeptide (TPR) repeat protein
MMFHPQNNPEITRNSTQIKVLEMANMMVHYQSNTCSFESIPKEHLMAYCEVLKNLGISKDFQNSLVNSCKLIDAPNQFSEFSNLLERLKENQDHSFVIFPFCAKKHLYSALIRKIKTSNHPKFSMTVVNTEDLFQNPYQEYIFETLQDLKDTLLEIHQGRKQYHPLDMDDILASSKGKSYSLNISAKGQSVGNCYTKQLDKVIKFAMIPYENVMASRKKAFFWQNHEPLTPKFMVKNKTFETRLVHQDYLDLLAKDHKNLKPSLDEIKRIYSSNKAFRSCILEKKHLGDQLPIYLQRLDQKSLDLLVSKGSFLLSLQPQNSFYHIRSLKLLNHKIDKVNDGLYSMSQDLLKETQDILTPELEKHMPYLYQFLKKHFSCLLFSKGEFYALKGYSPQAKNHFEESAKLNENNSFALLRLGSHYMKNHQSQKALTYFEKAYGVNPHDREINAMLYHVYMKFAHFFQDRKEYKQAKEYYQKTLKLLNIFYYQRQLIQKKLTQLKQPFSKSPCPLNSTRCEPNL